MFFTVVDRGRAEARGRVRFETTLVAAVIGAVVVLMVATPLRYREHTLSSPYISYPTVAGFYIVGGLYFVYGYGTSAWWTARFSLRTRGSLRVALVVLAGGLAGTTAASISRIVLVFLRANDGTPLRWLNTINFQTANVSNVLLSVGMLALGLAQIVPLLITWLRRRNTYHQLEPLWRTVADTYPELVLGRPQLAWPWRRIAPLTRRQAFYRRVMECRDGLVRFGPQIAAAAGGRDVAELSPREIAGHIQVVAGRTDPTGTRAATHDGAAVALAVPTTSAAGADVDELVAISTALSETS